jgi:hypothetical protein
MKGLVCLCHWPEPDQPFGKPRQEGYGLGELLWSEKVASLDSLLL